MDCVWEEGDRTNMQHEPGDKCRGRGGGRLHLTIYLAAGGGNGGGGARHRAAPPALVSFPRPSQCAQLGAGARIVIQRARTVATVCRPSM